MRWCGGLGAATRVATATQLGTRQCGKAPQWQGLGGASVDFTGGDAYDAEVAPWRLCAHQFGSPAGSATDRRCPRRQVWVPAAGAELAQWRCMESTGSLNPDMGPCGSAICEGHLAAAEPETVRHGSASVSGRSRCLHALHWWPMAAGCYRAMTMHIRYGGSGTRPRVLARSRGERRVPSLPPCHWHLHDASSGDGC